MHVDYHTFLLTNFSAGVSNMRPTKAFCAAHDTYWNFSNNYHFSLVNSLVFKSEPASEQAPSKRT